MVINTTWGHTIELGPLLYKSLYKFVKNFHNVRSVHIFAIVFVRNKFSTHYRVIFNYWCSHMNFLYAVYNFMKYGIRSLVARTQSLKSSFSCFICLKLVGYSQHHLKSMFLNIFCPFVWEKSTLLSFVFFFTFFAFFSKLWKMDLVASLHWPLQLSLVTRKPVFGVCNQVRLTSLIGYRS